MTIKIKGHEDFIRDAYSGAVINTNKQEYIKYKEKRNNNLNLFHKKWKD